MKTTIPRFQVMTGRDYARRASMLFFTVIDNATGKVYATLNTICTAMVVAAKFNAESPPEVPVCENGCEA